MDLFVALAQLTAFVAAALALALPRLRTPALGLLAIAAAVSIAHAVLGPAERTLTTVHTYAGFEGSNHEVSMVSFPTGTSRAPGWQWPLPFVGFAVLWGSVLRRLGSSLPARALPLPLAYAWTATAAWLGMQHLAAPAAVVQPVGLDRMLFPAGLALALLAARQATTLWAVLFQTSLATLAARLPAAVWSKLASDLRLGSCLDVSSVVDIVNPMTQMQFEPRLTPGSSQQQFWLIWLEHTIMFPALYLMSLFGVAFCAHMFHRHGPAARAEISRAEISRARAR